MTTNELIIEIEEAVRREKMEKAAREYGPYVLAGCALAILITAASAGWQSWQARTNAQHTAAVLTALDGSGEKGAQNLADIAASLGSGTGVVARLTSAGMFMQQNNVPEALKQFQLAAAEKDADPLLRDLAVLQSVRLEWDSATDKEAAAKGLIDKLLPLTGDKNNPWQPHARTQAAIITAHGLNDLSGARAILAKVLERKDTLPASLVQRASALDHVYAQRLGERADAAPAKTETQG